MRAAAVQLNSTDDRARNLEVAERLVFEAAADRAELVVLPEKWTILAGPDELRAGAEPLDGPALTAAGDWARELGIHLVAGSIAERVEGRDKLFNTSVLFGPDGEIAAVYRKIHLFDVDVGGVTYRESETEEPGEEIVMADAGAIPVGLSVCYDLRFPELYRILTVMGARVIAVPAAFTMPTGRDHWEVLVRARAIENQVFVVAADQVGEAPPHYNSFGRSMIVDPWGIVLTQAPDAECFIAADLDVSIQEEMRYSLPALGNRRPQAYRWPDENLKRRAEDLEEQPPAPAEPAEPPTAAPPAGPPAATPGPARPGPPELPDGPTMAPGPTPGGV
jgi:predicted amidohydrolase